MTRVFARAIKAFFVLRNYFLLFFADLATASTITTHLLKFSNENDACENKRVGSFDQHAVNDVI